MAAPSTFKIGLVQMRCSADPDDNLRARDRAHRGRPPASGAQLVCLPELFRSQYFCQTEDHANFDLAEPIPGPHDGGAGADGARRRGVVIIASLFERRAAGVYHNTAVVIDADGKLLGSYRKMHIPDDPLYYEKFYFTPGDLGFRAFDTACGRIGTLVCWDQWYPEAARLTALAGADVLFYPTAIGWHPSEKAEYGAGQASRLADGPARPRHRQRRLRRGRQPRRPRERPASAATGIEFWGGSFVADPFGRGASPRRRATEEETLIVDLRSHAPGDGPPQLAVPARPPHRRVRRDHAPAHRRMKRARRVSPDGEGARSPPAALGFRMPAEWEPHAATWIAWPHEPRDWPGKLAPHPLGLRRGGPPPRARRARAHPGRTTPPTRSARATCSARRRRPASACSCSRAPTDRSWTRDYCPIFVDERRRRGRRHQLALQRLGEVRRTTSATTRSTTASRDGSRLRQWQPTARSAAGRGAWCWRAAPSTSTARARCWRPRSACWTKVQARNPGLAARGAGSGAARRTWACARCCGSGAASPATTRTATSTTWPASSTRRRSSSRRRATPTTRTTSRCARTAPGSNA